MSYSVGGRERNDKRLESLETELPVKWLIILITNDMTLP